MIVFRRYALGLAFVTGLVAPAEARDRIFACAAEGAGWKSSSLFEAGTQKRRACPQPRIRASDRLMTAASFWQRDIWRPEAVGTPGGDKIVLKVAFLNGKRSERARVRAVAVDWTTGKLGATLGRRVQFAFVDQPQDAQVRVKFHEKDKGNDARVGTEAFAIAPTEPTVYLDDVKDRTIRHEFGHVLGLRHEHQNSARTFHFKPDAIYRDLCSDCAPGVNGVYGVHWPREKVWEEILSVNPDSACPVDGAHFEYGSVMMYSYPATWTREHIATTANAVISRGDRKCLEWAYGVRPPAPGQVAAK